MYERVTRNIPTIKAINAIYYHISRLGLVYKSADTFWPVSFTVSA
jgi:hypothetical protein